MVIHFSKASIPSSIRSSSPPFFSKHPGAKWLVRHNQQRRPVPSLLSNSYSMIIIILTNFVVRADGLVRWVGGVAADPPPRHTAGAPAGTRLFPSLL